MRKNSGWDVFFIFEVWWKNPTCFAFIFDALIFHIKKAFKQFSSSFKINLHRKLLSFFIMIRGTLCQAAARSFEMETNWSLPRKLTGCHQCQKRMELQVFSWGTSFLKCFLSACPGYETYDGSNFSEDCLYMNIYKPSGAQNLPIFIWIHGGGFVDGQRLGSKFKISLKLKYPRLR